MPTFDWECPGGHQFWAFSPTRDSSAPACVECGALNVERIWAITKRSGFSRYPYTTKHIDGKPMTITDAGMEARVLKEHNLVQRDDAAYETQSYHGWDFAKREQRYREDVSAGSPRSWAGSALPSGMCSSCCLARHEGECQSADVRS